MNSIHDEEGNLLCQTDFRTSDDGTTLMLTQPSGHAKLMLYVFGQGRRRVTVDFMGRTIPGKLATRWTNNRRTWLVRLSEPIPADERATSAAFSQGLD